MIYIDIKYTYATLPFLFQFIRENVIISLLYLENKSH